MRFKIILPSTAEMWAWSSEVFGLPNVVSVDYKFNNLHLDRLQNKYTNCKGVKNNSNFGQITRIQEKLDTTCKQNAS
jgi:hypothetical protein